MVSRPRLPIWSARPELPILATSPGTDSWRTSISSRPTVDPTNWRVPRRRESVPLCCKSGLCVASALAICACAMPPDAVGWTFGVSATASMAAALRPTASRLQAGPSMKRSLRLSLTRWPTLRSVSRCRSPPKSSLARRKSISFGVVRSKELRLTPISPSSASCRSIPASAWFATRFGADWNDKLRALATAREDYERALQDDERLLGEAVRDRLVAMPADFKRLWVAPPHTRQTESARE